MIILKINLKMVKKCRFCKKEDHYINDCNHFKIPQIVKKLEDKIYSLKEYESEEIKIQLKLLIKSFSAIDLALLCVKNNLPLNLSKINYISLFLEIYINHELIKFINNYSLNTILSDYLHLNGSILNRNLININERDTVINMIDRKISKSYDKTINNLVINIKDLINNKKYFDILFLYDKNNKEIYNDIIFFYFDKYKKNINIENCLLDSIESNIINLYFCFYENLSIEYIIYKIKNILNNILFSIDLKTLECIFIYYSNKYDYIKSIFDKEKILNYFTDIFLKNILNKIELNMNIKSNNIDIKLNIFLIEHTINNFFNFEDVFEIIDIYSSIIEIYNKSEIKNYIVKFLNKNEKYLLFFLYYKYFNKLDCYDTILIINKIADIYLIRIENKIKRIINLKKDEYNESFKNISLKIIDLFSINYYLYFPTYSIKYILEDILYHSCDIKSKLLLIYKIKHNKFNNYILDYYLFRGDIHITILNYFEKYINKMFILFSSNRHLLKDNLILNNYEINIRKNIYFYYSLYSIKNNDIKPEIIIDNLYLLKINSDNNSNINYSIIYLINYLLKINYPFSYESKYYEKTIIENINHNQTINELLCPICLEENSNIITDCNHNICNNCFEKQKIFVKPYCDIKCCMCRNNIKKIYSNNI